MPENYGILVSEEGYDVSTAGDKNLTLKTGFSLLNEFASGSVVMDSNPETITHSLGYAPQFLVWAIYPDYPDYEGLDTVLLMTANFDAGSAYTTTTALNLQPSSGQGSTSEAKYYIFYEPLTTGTPAAVAGDEYGVVVSKDGFDVATTNMNQKTLDSKFNSMKIFTEDTEISTGSTDIDIAIPHGLNVIPGYLIYFKVGSGKWYSTWEKEDVSGANVQVGAISETSNLYLQIRRTGNCTVTVKYYIFVDPGN